MKKENWLDPISLSDATLFSHYSMGIYDLKNLVALDDLSYGKFFQFEGFKKNEMITQWGSPRKLFSLSLGEFGPIYTDPYLENSTNDLKQLFGDDEELINIYLAWVFLVAKKNGDRKINGKTYLESFSEACNKNIDLVKTAQINKIERDATEKKNCVSSFVSQISKKQNTQKIQKNIFQK